MKRSEPICGSDLEFLTTLASLDGVRVGPYGQRTLLYRWASAVTSPICFARHGSAGRGLFQVVLWAPLGYPALLLERRMVKYIAVTAADRRAGLILHRVRDKGGLCWQISSFWAWPTGHGHGLPVINAVMSAADTTGTAVQLRAANQRLARDYYTRLGFEFHVGEQNAVRPRILRPATGRIQQDAMPPFSNVGL